jgi:hypothetical protein
VLELFISICEAIAYAHQRGVIHRDLKPSNVIVCEETSAASGVDAAAAVKVLDFGLARVTDGEARVQTAFTDAGHMVGTMPYMSPEQVRSNPDDIDLRTDVYSLGVMLFRLVTGALPHALDNLTIVEAARIICDEPHARLPLLSQSADSDVRAIVLKAIEKDPARRYQTVSALADDVTRYLNDLPVLAKPPSAAYQLSKLVRRHKPGVAAVSTVVVLLVVLAASMTIQARRLAIERDRANREGQTSKQIADFMVGLFTVSDPSEARGNSVTAREILDRGADRISADLGGQPLVQARLMTVMGSVYYALGLFRQQRQAAGPRAVDPAVGARRRRRRRGRKSRSGRPRDAGEGRPRWGGSAHPRVAAAAPEPVRRTACGGCRQPQRSRDRALRKG